MRHRFDKLLEEMRKRGWRKDSVYGCLLSPIDKSAIDLENDWISAIENSVVCVADPVDERSIAV